MCVASSIVLMMFCVTFCRHWGSANQCKVQRSPLLPLVRPISACRRVHLPYHWFLSVCGVCGVCVWYCGLECENSIQ